MILDTLNTFAGPAAVATSGTGLFNVGNAIQVSKTNLFHAIGLVDKPMWLVSWVSTAFTSGGSATVTFRLVTEEAATLPVDGSEDILLTTGAIPVASLVAGYWIFRQPLPLPLSTPALYKKHIGIQALVGTAALTAGAIHAALVVEPEYWRALPEANS